MTSHQNKYLEMLKTDFGKKPLPKDSKPSFEGFEGTQDRPISGFEGFEGTQDRPVSPPYDAERVPCGGCPKCNQGEYWRRPKFHKDHNPTGWVCWFCSPPLEDKFCCDFCGVPDSMLKKRK